MTAFRSASQGTAGAAVDALERGRYNLSSMARHTGGPYVLPMRGWPSAPDVRAREGLVHMAKTTNRSRRPLLVALVLFMALVLGACPGCGGEPAESAPASALRQRFPDRAALVLEQGEAFAARGEEFALDGPGAEGASRGVEVTLPHEAREAIRFRGFEGAEVRVREIGVEGEGALVKQAVAYRRTGGASFWTASSGGVVEEWLHLEAGAVRAGEEAAAWEVEGATVRQRGEGVEIVDGGGVVRLSVTAPAAYGAGGREVGARLVGSGARIELLVDAGGEDVLVDPLWASAGSMSQTRQGHTATLLQNGQVLVAGGDTGALNSPIATAEMYNPATNSWSPLPAMFLAREHHTATLLGSGKVLVVGGYYGPSAELYDPTTNTWSPGGSLSGARSYHTATLLGNGQVLVAAGLGVASAEMYDPATNTWSPAGMMSQARYGHTATQLPDGKVLVAGGSSGGYSSLASAELYDPATNTWSPAASMSEERFYHPAALLGSGKVLVIGGESQFGQIWTSELYDPATDTWSPAGPMSQPRTNHTGTLLGNGMVLVTGGYGGALLPSAELYDPVTDIWLPAGMMSQGRYEHTATLLANGKVLVAGGPAASAELYSAPLAPLGSLCAAASACQSGFCADGVCCNAACNAGPCDACSVAAGAAVDGTCALLTGPACTDGNACTQSDTCKAGVCVGANPVACALPDQCHLAGACNPATGTCSNPAKLDGAACDDGDACTQSDTCEAGVCLGAQPVVCTSDACHLAGVCDPATGLCDNPANADGTPCNDGDACTQSDTCHAGACAGSDPVVCTALDTCHVPGQCDPATGVCVNPAKPDTASCDDGDACTQTDTCQDGVCKGANPVECKAKDDCQGAGTCDSKTGICSTPAKPDGAPCADGTCSAGVCTPTPNGGSSSSSSGGGGATGTGDSSSSSSGGSGGGGATGTSGCSCNMVGAPDLHPAWLGLALGLLLVWRRREPRTGPRARLLFTGSRCRARQALAGRRRTIA
jgi:MYXO-CTERM domain-containing protein